MIKLEYDEELDQCVSCGNSDIELNLTDFRGVKISRCNSCHLQFMNPQYSDEYLDEYYSTYTDSENDEGWDEALLYGHNYYFTLIEKHIDVGEMLDVGCGAGHLLEAGAKRGWVGHGYDVDEQLTQNTSKRLGVDIGCGDFMTCELGGDYDLATMHQVLEHVKNPVQYIDKINSLMKKNGCFFVAVPNIKSLANRVKFRLERMGIRKKHIGKYYDTAHHIIYFEPKTLVSLLEDRGFKVVYERNGHSTRPKQSKLSRFLMRNITDYLFSKSTFLVIAKKI